KTSCFRQFERIVVDEISTGKSMRKHAFTLRPKLDIGDIGKGQIDGSYGAFCPLALYLAGIIPISFLCGKIKERKIYSNTMWKGMNSINGTSNHPSGLASVSG